MGFAKLCVHIKEAQHTSNALLCVESVLKVRCGFAAYADRAEWGVYRVSKCQKRYVLFWRVVKYGNQNRFGTEISY